MLEMFVIQHTSVWPISFWQYKGFKRNEHNVASIYNNVYGDVTDFETGFHKNTKIEICWERKIIFSSNKKTY